MSAMTTRRSMLRTTGQGACALLFAEAIHAEAPQGFRPLFDGKSLAGWHQRPRIMPARIKAGQAARSPFEKANDASLGRWEVRDGVILGGQAEQRTVHPQQNVDWGFGGWLMTDEKFGDFELLIDAHPEWPCDTGIYVRTTDDGLGFQVLLDHRGDDAKGVGGSVGFIYCKGMGNMRVDPNNFRWETGADGLP